MRSAYPLLFIIFYLSSGAKAQDNPSAVSSVLSSPGKLFSAIDKKTRSLEQNLDIQAKKYLSRIAREEKRLIKKLKRKDSAAANRVLESAGVQYKQMAKSLQDSLAGGGPFKNVYSPCLDSIHTALSFLQKNKLLNSSSRIQEQYAGSYTAINALQRKLNQTEAVRKYLVERKNYLQQQLEQVGLVGEMKKLKQEVIYYQLQLEEYKNMLNKPQQLEAKLLEILSKTKAFNDFFNKYSALAGLFRLPGAGSSGAEVAGLQTREMLQQDLQRLGLGPNVSQLVQQNVQGAQGQLNQLKDKISKAGAGDAGDMPDFKPNSQKTKSFWNRLEYGTNLQTQKSGNFFPATSDIGLSVGFKLNDKSVIGIGGSYKVGWGKDFRHIAISSQGAALRSFLDVKLKGSFFASGGFEYNYQPLSYTQALTSQELQQVSTWQQSGLLGISKIISLKSKMFKKTKLQLLWDFMSYQQVPRTQALKFRIGYTWR